MTPTTRVTPKEGLGQLPTPEGKRSVGLFRHGTLELKLYAPRGRDDQQPHTRDEAYIVVSGRGEFVRESERVPFEPGDFLFAPAGVPHQFENFTDDFAVWVLFYGPEGGESGPGLKPGLGPGVRP